MFCFRVSNGASARMVKYKLAEFSMLGGCWDRVEDTVSIPVELGKNYFALAFTFDSLSYHRKEASPLSFTFCLSKGIFLEILSKSLFLLL